ncbi:unnamed protein product [Rotaria magnacalcarata]|uniref:Pleckstrin homology domain-containing family A member 8 n=3 Tax=Rotaria magnacalcarata TaxID=392030 RepID=A0A815QDC7_9BILA|nr:unnamed protein product [Rotaria magnacalcarata]CAF1620586.1 unnamed protein product [Rotaria magnacalcarata]CAF1997988.1 unnamed protein product [Rotaria magnacalcarata]CAF2204489.1 unnamed protein product [Rotaria magnacalcarata]
MEGKLFKWTNYYNGWQPRYFVLNETGVLSYYKSSELIHEGCKGSFLVPACEVKVHPHDPFRFDLIIPGEQFFCLKAKSQPERQRWLVALGTCKSRGTKSTTSTIISNNSNNNNNNFSHLNAVDHEIKIKVQELHLYETVLTQRIHAIKSIANDTPIPDIKKLDESTSMLSVTCDAFIHTLDECIKLATGNSSQSLLLLSPSSLTAISDDISILQQSFCSIDSTKLKNSTDTVLPKQNFFKTFFSELSYSFAELTSLKFEEIHSELFLSTCEQYINLIEKFNSKTFIPLRADANGNINKLKRKISNDPNKFQTLYSIVNDEIIAKTTKEKNSATDALLWLKRSIHFLGCFLHEYGQDNQTVEDAMNKAYGQTLKRFHGWITRGVFSIALRSVPYKEEFLVSLAVNSNDAREVLFEQQIMNEMLEHSLNMNSVVNKITEFYIEHELESDEIIG